MAVIGKLLWSALAAASAAAGGGGGLRGSPAPDAGASGAATGGATDSADLSLDLGVGDAAVNASFLADFDAALDAALGARRGAGAAPLLDLAGLPEVPAPWAAAIGERGVGNEEALGGAGNGTAEGLTALAARAPPGTCARYRCVEHRWWQKCQCNIECVRHGDCCPDYQAQCSRHGGGQLVVQRAWVAMLAGGTDKKFQQLLCNVVKKATKGPICHNGIIFQGSVNGKAGYYFLEYGNSGYPDELTGRKKWGLSIAPAAERFKSGKVLAREIHGDFSASLSRVVEQVRDVPYFLSLAAIIRLQHRENKRFSEHLMCSDFTANVLVGIGCLHNDKASWNAQPTDFSSSATSHQLRFTCPVGQDFLFDTRGK